MRGELRIALQAIRWRSSALLHPDVARCLMHTLILRALQLSQAREARWEARWEAEVVAVRAQFAMAWQWAKEYG